MKRNMLKTALAIVLIMVFTFSIAGCGSQPAEKAKTDGQNVQASTATTDTTSKKPDKKLKVAYLVADLENPAWKTISDGFTQGATDLKMDVKSFTASGDANTQMKNAQDLITQQYDGIAMSATDSTSAPAVLKAAKEANIPVVLLHIASDEGEYLTLVRSQDEKGGYDCGKAIADTINKKGLKGKVAEISISLARINGKNRDAGFQKAMKEAGISVLEVKQAVKYTRDEAYKFTQDLITANPDLIGIFCNYDEAALGSMKAILDNNKKDKIVLGGYDGSPESVDAIKKGNMDAMSMQPLYLHGKTAAKILYDYATSKKVPEKLTETPIVLVTKDNIAQEEAKMQEDCFGPKK